MLLLFFFLIPSYCGGCYFFLSHSCECLFNVLQFKFLVLCEIMLQNVLTLTAFVNNKKELLIHSIYLLLFVIIICCTKISTCSKHFKIKDHVNNHCKYILCLHVGFSFGAETWKHILGKHNKINVKCCTDCVVKERATLDSKKSKDQRMGLINLMRLRRHKIFVRFLWFIKRKKKNKNQSWK